MNRSAISYRLDRLFREQAARTPDAVALVEGDDSMTFAGLDAASDRLATAIRIHGIRDGAFVGLHMERSIRHVVALLAILKTNCAVVPLPPSWPSNRLRGVLAFAALDGVIDDHDTSADPLLHERILHFTDLADAEAEPAAADAGDPDVPAFVLCSSGSTGNPKMIVRSHRSFFHRLQWTWHTHPYTPGEVCCQKAHMTTTHAIYELFEPLLRGIRVCIIPDEVAKTLGAFWDVVRQQGVSRLLIVPSVLRASLDMPGFTPPAVNVLVLMGEYVDPALAARAVAAFPQTTKIHSIYGSTEASSVLVCDLADATRGDGDELPLGKPISPDVRAHVLGDDLAPVAPGAPGMLYIEGPALFTGYFRDPALTAAALILGDHGQRMYRTNDRVRVAPDGALQFLGRIDDTVKIRGFRVDLQEVERAVAAVPGVIQCAVVAKDSGDGSAMLVAFVVPPSLQPHELHEALREQLPGYMLPSRVVGLDVLPRTASGKVDRRKLLEERDASAATPAPARFRSATESRVAEAWTAVLAHHDFGPDSNFFEVGGTSLKTFFVVARLRDAFALGRRQLPDDAVYRFPTIETLASHIDAARSGGTVQEAPRGSMLVTLKSGARHGAAPLFVISSAGGTLGAYEKLIHALRTDREIIGVRDPFLWGERNAACRFQAWVASYVDAIRTRQPEGPYRLLAYSSAGAFGFEVAQQLRRQRQEVVLLALIDPLAMDRASKRRFGYWALEARFMRQPFARIALLIGRLRGALPRRFRSGHSARSNDFAFTPEQVLELERQAKTSRQSVLGLSALMELNTGLPVALAREDLAGLESEHYFDALLAKVARVAPEMGAETIERIAVQYAQQVRAQNLYRLQRYDGEVVLFDPDDAHQPLVEVQIKPCVRRLVAHRVALGTLSDRACRLSRYFPEAMRSHYLCMRDDAFVAGVARALDKLL